MIIIYIDVVVHDAFNMRFGAIRNVMYMLCAKFRLVHPPKRIITKIVIADPGDTMSKGIFERVVPGCY